jgi:hypothetical protein
VRKATTDLTVRNTDRTQLVFSVFLRAKPWSFLLYTFSMIQIPLTPDQYAATSKLIAEKQGIALTGDAGKITKMGVTAGYKYADGILAIDILEKPFFVTTEYCEEQIKAWFASH